MLSFHLASIKNTVSKRKRKNPDILVGSFIRIIKVSCIYMYVQMSNYKEKYNLLDCTTRINTQREMNSIYEQDPSEENYYSL